MPYNELGKDTPWNSSPSQQYFSSSLGTNMDFDPAPYMAHPLVATIGLVSTLILMTKGTVVVLTEFFRMLPPLIQAVKDCWRSVKNGRANHQ